MNDDEWVPTTAENWRSVPGPFYHGTKVHLSEGDFLAPGYPSNYEAGRALRHVYFSANLEPAAWGAELSVALSGLEGRGHIYLVEPTGPFEDDPNLTNKRFPGNPTRSYRTSHPLRIMDVVVGWIGHTDEEIQRMFEGLRSLRERGLAIIED